MNTLKSAIFRVIALWSLIFIPTCPSWAGPLGPEAQKLLDAEMQIARDLLNSPEMTRDEYQRRVLAAVPANATEDDRNTALAFAWQTFTQLDTRRELAKEESHIDQSTLLQGPGVSSREKIRKSIITLTKVNHLLQQIEQKRAEGLADFERSLKQAKVSPARMALELQAAERREMETRKEWETQTRITIQNKASLNEECIKILQFLEENWGEWEFREQYSFKNEELLKAFQEKLKLVEDAEKKYFGK